LEERRQLAAEASALRQKLALGGGGEGGSAAPRTIGGVPLLTQVLDGVSAKELRGLVDAQKARIGSGAVVLIADTGGKVAIAVGVTDDLTARLGRRARPRGGRSDGGQRRRRSPRHGPGWCD
jgi:alanyl-tRNA synthetase